MPALLQPSVDRTTKRQRADRKSSGYARSLRRRAKASVAPAYRPPRRSGPLARQGRHQGGVDSKLLAIPKRQAVGINFKPPVVDSVDLQIHVCQTGFASDTGHGKPARRTFPKDNLP